MNSNITTCIERYHELNRNLLRAGLSMKEFCERLPAKDAEMLRKIQLFRNEYVHSSGKGLEKFERSVFSTWNTFLGKLLTENI